MKNFRGFIVGVLLIVAVDGSPADTAITVYNQNFAVVRDSVQLNLKRGNNDVSVAGMTAFLEPESVVLRDPTGEHQFRILEQNYRADPVTEELLLSLYEGRTVSFEVPAAGGELSRRLVSGRIIRSGYTSHGGFGYSGVPSQPLIEVDGLLQFGLPGKPLFPALVDDTVLTPTLNWIIESAEDAQLTAELSYVTGEMSWEADYNLVLPEEGNMLDLAGWVTIDNRSRKTFDNARIKLMAGDVSKIRRSQQVRYGGGFGGGGGGGGFGPPAVTEKSFDEYHLYTLERETTLRDAQKKQVEFVRAEGVNSSSYYTYDGADLSENVGWLSLNFISDATFGTKVNKKVAVTREFKNTEENQLGLPLPKGRVRVYRRDADGRLEFTGENTIDHTPRDETVRLDMGYVFDIVGDRKQTHINVHNHGNVGYVADPLTGAPIAVPQADQVAERSFIDESFEITLRNRKKTPVEVRVVEHLYRYSNWEIQRPSDEFTKLDARTIEFRVNLEPNEVKVIEYTAHYTWN